MKSTTQYFLADSYGIVFFFLKKKKELLSKTL